MKLSKQLKKILDLHFIFGVTIVVISVIAYLFKDALIYGKLTFTHDTFLWVYPIFTYFADGILHGHIPMWNPFTRGGEPIFASYIQTHLLDVADVACIYLASFFTNDLTIIFNWDRFLRFILTGVGSYLLLQLWAVEKITKICLLIVALGSYISMNGIYQPGFCDQYYLAPFIAYFLILILEGDDRWRNWLAIVFFMGQTFQSYFFVGPSTLIIIIILYYYILHYKKSKIDIIRPNPIKLLVCFSLLLLTCMPMLAMLVSQQELYLSARSSNYNWMNLFEGNGGEPSDDISKIDQESFLFLPYNFIRLTGAVVDTTDFISLFTPYTLSECNFFFSTLAFFISLIGIFYAKNKYKNLWLIVLFTFGSLMLGRHSIIYAGVYHIYPLLWLVRHSEQFLNFFILALLYFFVIGCDLILSEKNITKTNIIFCRIIEDIIDCFRNSADPQVSLPSVYESILCIIPLVVTQILLFSSGYLAIHSRDASFILIPIFGCFFYYQKETKSIFLCLKSLGKKFLIKKYNNSTCQAKKYFFDLFCRAIFIEPQLTIKNFTKSIVRHRICFIGLFSLFFGLYNSLNFKEFIIINFLSLCVVGIMLFFLINWKNGSLIKNILIMVELFFIPFIISFIVDIRRWMPPVRVFEQSSEPVVLFFCFLILICITLRQKIFSPFLIVLSLYFVTIVLDLRSVDILNTTFRLYVFVIMPIVFYSFVPYFSVEQKKKLISFFLVFIISWDILSSLQEEIFNSMEKLSQYSVAFKSEVGGDPFPNKRTVLIENPPYDHFHYGHQVLRFPELLARTSVALSTPFTYPQFPLANDLYKQQPNQKIWNTFYMTKNYRELLGEGFDSNKLANYFSINEPIFKFYDVSSIDTDKGSINFDIITKNKKHSYNDFLHIKQTSCASVNYNSSSFDIFELNVFSECDGYLYLADGYSKYWKAFVNNNEVPILRTNTNFKSIYLQKGTSDIKFIYRPNEQIISLFLYASTIIISGGIFLILECLSRISLPR